MSRENPARFRCLSGLITAGLLAAGQLAASTAHAEPSLAERMTSARVVDLTHVYDETTVYWPTDTHGFELRQLSHGETEGGWFYAANSFCTAEHGGTHLDAPIHFSASGRDVASIPVEQFIGPGVVIDITDRTASDRDYRLTVADIERDEAAHGPIPPGAIVLLRTGWSRYWSDRKAYLGDDTPGDASNLSFPSYGEAAARVLIDERKVAAIGLDTASIDFGKTRDFIVHRVAAAAQIPGLENLTRLDELPARGFAVVALPTHIGGGSGGPVRAIALIEPADAN